MAGAQGGGGQRLSDSLRSNCDARVSDLSQFVSMKEFT
jgi:hypothetical protein